jgi:4-diphosphocytidyl-2-C-methyl-D-erythritol kinase
VPFFIGGHNAFVEGIGERLTPVALRPQRFAVAKPAAAIATADIFGSPDLARDTEPVILTGYLASAGWGDGFGRNDLQPVAEARCPEVRAVAEWLQGSFGNSRMTGSGSAVFSRVGMEDQSLATWPAQALPGPWIVRLCRSLDHHPLLGWAD